MRWLKPGQLFCHEQHFIIYQGAKGGALAFKIMPAALQLCPYLSQNVLPAYLAGLGAGHWSRSPSVG
jgi:hypothetical protein